VDELPAAVPRSPRSRTGGASVKRQKAEALALQRANAIVAEAKAATSRPPLRRPERPSPKRRDSPAPARDKLPGDVMVAALEAPAGARPRRQERAGLLRGQVHERFAPT